MNKRMRNKITTTAKKHIYTRYFEQSQLTLKRIGSTEFEEREGEVTVGVRCEIEDELGTCQDLLVVCEFEQDSISWVLVTAEPWDA